MSRPITAAGNWVVFPRPTPGARMRLFCFPYAGGGASIYYSWPRALPPEVELCSVQLPGRESRLMETPYAAMPELVEKLYEVLLPFFDRPFAFFGHSNGAIMAFELTRLLRRRGKPMPLHFFPSGRPGPQIPDPNPPIHALPEADFHRELRRFKGTPEEVLQNAEIMQLITPMLRADFSLSETYRYTPEPPLDLPISAYGGRTDDEVSEEEVSGWREQTTAAFEQHMFPGDHFFINGDRDAVLEVLARELRANLARIGGAAARV